MVGLLFVSFSLYVGTNTSCDENGTFPEVLE